MRVSLTAPAFPICHDPILPICHDSIFPICHASSIFFRWTTSAEGLGLPAFPELPTDPSRFESNSGSRLGGGTENMFPQIPLPAIPRILPSWEHLQTLRAPGRPQRHAALGGGALGAAAGAALVGAAALGLALRRRPKGRVRLRRTLESPQRGPC